MSGFGLGLNTGNGLMNWEKCGCSAGHPPGTGTRLNTPRLGSPSVHQQGIGTQWKSSMTPAWCCCQWVSKTQLEERAQMQGWELCDADTHSAMCTTWLHSMSSQVPLWPRRRLLSARLLLHEWLWFEQDMWVVGMACPGCSSLTTDHTLFPAEGCWPLSWELSGFDNLGLS